MRIWIVVPAYNEERSIGEVLDAFKREGWSNVIVVDDGSRDRTSAIARSKGALVISRQENVGLGAALRTGLGEALRRKADRVVTFDADGQHDPKAIRTLVEGLDGADLVIGIRQHLGIPLHKRVGNFILNLITYLFSGVLIDSQSGSRAFSRRALERMRIRSDRYEVSSELIIQASRLRLSIRRVPVRCFYTEYSRARGTTIASGIGIFWKLLVQR